MEIVTIGNPTTANAQTDKIETSVAGTGGKLRVVITPRGENCNYRSDKIFYRAL